MTALIPRTTVVRYNGRDAVLVWHDSDGYIIARSEMWCGKLMAMPEVVYKTLIDNATPLPPGKRVESQVIDVSGAREVNIMVGIVNTDAAVTWEIRFGPTTNNGYALCREGTFGSLLGGVAVSVPVFGTGMFVVVANNGQNNQHVDGKVYFIRDLP
jgi:hypothetical protein